MEDDPARKLIEDGTFQGSSNEVEGTRTATPGGWQNNVGTDSHFVSMLNKPSGHIVGPNKLMKVMAGDQMNASVDFYYDQAAINNGSSLATDVVTALLSSIGSSSVTSTAVKAGAGNIGSGFSGASFNSITDPDNNTADNLPRAYLSVLFFDERFQFVGESSQSLRVNPSDNGIRPLVLPTDIKVPKNGYAYIYLSNESNVRVYFDNLKVGDTRGRIIEEDHYYAYGLKIAGISSKKLDVGIEGSLKNGYGYQGAFSELDEDLGWNDFALRSYDPQIGRWLQMDPYNQFASGYVGIGCDPVNNMDPSGGIIGEILSETYPNFTVTAARLAPHILKAVGLGARVLASIVTQSAPYYIYRNATSELTTSTNHSESYTDKSSGEQMYLAGMGQDTYQKTVDVTGQYLQAQKEAYENASALGAFRAGLSFSRVGGTGGNTDIYRNGIGQVKYVTHPEALGNDELGSTIIFNILTLKPGAIGSTELGGGRIFNHFTDIEGVGGITGASSKALKAMKTGESMIVNKLEFGSGTNGFMANNEGDIFVTELSTQVSKGQLNQIGVFGNKQAFAISFSEENAFSQGVRVTGANPARSIYTIPGNTALDGNFMITKTFH